ncbi:MAG: hypothetical protein MUC92_10700 [Fimbriimonadaceae bacterium]|jgi:hypothetical protein|nr:hypothetical protein [Fimbriimonadaceae bacterium]
MQISRLVSLLAILLISALASGQTRLANYSEFYQSLMKGQSVRVVVEYAKTQLTFDGEEVPAPDATGGMVLESWEWFAKGVVRNDRAYVASSKTVLIDHPRYGYVNNYVRFRIYEDGEVEITARYLETGTNKVLMHEVFKGKISDGKDKNGVHLFSQSR